MHLFSYCFDRVKELTVKEVKVKELTVSKRANSSCILANYTYVNDYFHAELHIGCFSYFTINFIIIRKIAAFE